jgi:hypothetical protein
MQRKQDLSERYLAVAQDDVHGLIKQGKRASKYDARISICYGEVILVVSIPGITAPQTIHVPGGESSLDYHPGNIIVRVPKREDTVLYQCQLFSVVSNEGVMRKSAAGMIAKGTDPINFVELMERLVVEKAQKGDYNEKDEMQWEKYLKLRARFVHPTTPAPEALSAKRLGSRIIAQICFPTNGG